VRFGDSGETWSGVALVYCTIVKWFPLIHIFVARGVNNIKGWQLFLNGRNKKYQAFVEVSLTDQVYFCAKSFGKLFL
jgi:hypothetical protein